MARDGHRHVLAIGGLRGESAGSGPDGSPLLLSYAARLTGSRSPRICMLNTAMGDDPGAYLRTYQLLGALPGRVTHLQLFPMPNAADPEDLLLSQDMIFVGGGSVANMLAVWQVHGVDAIMRKAWQAGVVLSGVSAGAICWFSGGTTDSFGTALRPFTGGLGLFTGSYCPHYDSEDQRRPLYRSLIGDGVLPAGLACDDGAAAHMVDDALAGIVADGPGPRGYFVDAAQNGSAEETALGTRVLGGR
ncbi:MAG TPA: peptidase E [Streptosporangiaceae bacterium]|nr:peptidase E [Streptosporangiaceae bacterium]